MEREQKDMFIKVGIIAGALLAVFLLSKTIGEIVSWSDPEMYPSRTVTVVAEGEALAVADIASFSFSVNEEGTTSDDAQNKVTEKINKALQYLKDNGVEEKDIKTENYSISPKYETVAPCYAFDCPNPTPKIVGYTVSQTIRIKVRDIDNTGKFLSELTKFEINNVSGISFTIDDTDVLYDLARKDAVAKAEQKARSLAKELGVKIGEVISFSEDNSQYYGQPEYGMGGDMAMVKATPQIPKGENSYTTRVYVTYELK